MNASESANRDIDDIVGELTRQDPFRVWKTAVDNHIAAADPEFVVALARAAAPKLDPDLGRALLDSAFRSLLGAQIAGKVTAALHIVSVMAPTISSPPVPLAPWRPPSPPDGSGGSR
ncbi:hypothetical protein ACFU44_30425 [Nocardia rhizosphaerihabitans]|uniref:hypothetical protein n=1 Tax=Nocardia rhizosphaerihabitans TaxID=1691570 RepID=UPI00366CE79F